MIRAHEIPDAMHVLADPRRQVYDPLGTVRVSKLKLMTGVVPALRALAEGHVPSLTRSDMQRLGADAVVDAEGEIVFLHAASSPDDRVDPRRLTAALER